MISTVNLEKNNWNYLALENGLVWTTEILSYLLIEIDI